MWLFKPKSDIPNYAKKYADEIWIMSDGKKIYVGEMELQHLRNALRTLLRKQRIEAQNRFDVMMGSLDSVCSNKGD